MITAPRQKRQHPGINIDHGHPVTEGKNELAVFGFWIFLMSDAVLFALLFATYSVMLTGTGDGPGPAAILSLDHALIETAVLLISSVTFGAASLALQRRDRAKVLVWLVVTFLLGATFLWLEYTELASLASDGARWDRSGYLAAFFTLLGTHGLHVAAGMIWLLVLAAQTIVFGLSGPVASRLLRLGLFWHFLDIMWIGIYSVVYLGGLVT